MLRGRAGASVGVSHGDFDWLWVLKESSCFVFDAKSNLLKVINDEVDSVIHPFLWAE